MLKAIAETVSAGGGKKSANDLLRVCETLDGFEDLTIAELADLLAKADYYIKTGKLRRPGGASKKAAIDPQRVDEAAQEILELYESSIDESVHYDAIAEGVRKLETLRAGEVIEVAKQVGIARRLTSKSDALGEIRLMIEQRKESFQRTAF